LISPLDTAGQNIADPAPGLDADHAWIIAATPISGEQTSGNVTVLAATRTSHGWVLHDLNDPAHPGELNNGLEARTADSQRTIVSVCKAVGLQCFGTDSWERIDADGTRLTLLSAPAEFAPQAVGVSDDLSQMIFSADPAEPLLAQDTHAQGHGLYSSNDGVLEFLGVDPSGTPFPCGAVLANNDFIVASNSFFGTGFEQNGLSADGRTVIFESPEPFQVKEGHCPGPIDLYVRANGHTVNISAPRNAHPDQGAVYAGNSRDGNTIYFTTASQLVASDTDNLTDVYAYDRPTDTITPITRGADIQDSGAPGGKEVVVSPNGDYVYFVAGNAIAGQGSNGAQNLFLYHDGAITHIATTTQGFSRFGESMSSGFSSPTTPDGRHLLFLSKAPLTGQPSGGHLQLFRYAADSNAMTCVSCAPDGHTPTTEVVTSAMRPPTNLDQRLQSDDGSAIIFETRESLVPQDTNDQYDPYMWKNGKLYLLTRGHSQVPSAVTGVTPDGEGVYFTSAEGLAPGTTDSTVKLYIARNDPLPPAAAASPTCEGDACQGLLSEPPPSSLPASLSSSGLGNLAPPATTPPAVKAAAKPPTNAQKLSKALKACHKKPRGQRRKCESQARKRYHINRASKTRRSR
jgi:hypothetical protein